MMKMADDRYDFRVRHVIRYDVDDNAVLVETIEGQEGSVEFGPMPLAHARALADERVTYWEDIAHRAYIYMLDRVIPWQ